MTFLWPAMLLTLLLVPLVLLCFLLVERRRSRYAVRFTNIDVLAGVLTRSSAWRRYVPVALFLVALAAASVALARPRVTTAVPREDASVVITVDTSGSMLASDVKPTRLGAAQEAVRRFLGKVPSKFRVGMVAFSSEPQIVAPLTTDRKVVEDSLDLLFPGAGTAIGDALQRSVQLARTATEPDTADGSKTPPPDPQTGKDKRPITAILFLSDGFQTRGTLQPMQGAQIAKQAGIPVYTVALGTAEGVVSFGQGPYARQIPVPPDPDTLRAIARATGGEFFAARTSSEINRIYEHLGSKLGHTSKPREVTYAFLGLSALLLVGAGALSALWAQRLP
jgi:Ca-activated chloride channel family protein